MNVNLFFKSLKEIRISWPSYAIGLALYVLLLISIYPSISEQSEELERIFKTYPEGVLEFFGGGSALNFQTPEGFLALEIFAFMWFVILGAFVIAYGTGAMGKELDSGTIEILLSQPITRTSALMTKALTLFGGTAGLVLVTMGSTYLFGRIYDVALKSEGIIALGVIGALFFSAIGSFSLFFSVFLGERGRAAFVSAGLLVAMYILTILSDLADWAEELSRLSLFRYYDSSKLLSTGDIPTDSALVYVGTILVFLVGSVIVFNRRDIAP